MAWKRSDWNDIIQQVNDLADECSLAHLPEVDPDHIWTVTDIEDVRDKLIEICSDNSFSTELVLWTQETIDEINAAIAAGSCCCVDDCSNALGTVETYLGSVHHSGFCVAGNCGNPTNCNEADSCNIANRLAATNAGSEAYSEGFQGWTDWVEYCSLKKEADALQAQLTILQAKVPPNQAAIAAKQGELDAKVAERDAKLAESVAHDAAADAAADSSMALSLVCVPMGGMTRSYASCVPGEPWADTDCDELGPDCLGHVRPRCQVTYWGVEVRTVSVNGTRAWGVKMSGSYTRSGKPFVVYIYGCGGEGHYSGWCCGPGCDDGSSTPYDAELRLIQAYPEPTEDGETCCD